MTLTFTACLESNAPLGAGEIVATGTGGTVAASSGGGVGGTSTNDRAMSEACTGQPVSWQTNVVSLQADDFWILADGLCYTAAGAVVDIHSDPGSAIYNTLELKWTEHDRPMRLFIYFAADSANWWSGEMRTYDGQIGYSADWLFYYGTFFKSPIGKTFTGDIDLSNDASDTLRGRLHLGGVKLSNSMRGN